MSFNDKKSGPQGVSLKLYKKGASADAVPYKETTSVSGGDFTFYDVLPGNYVVKASHPKWKFSVVGFLFEIIFTDFIVFLSYEVIFIMHN